MEIRKSFINFQLSLTSEILISLILLMIVTIALIGIISLGILEATTKSEIPSRADIIAETINKTLNRLARQEGFSINSITPEIGYYTNVQDIAIVDKNLKNISGFHDTMTAEERDSGEEALKQKKIIKRVSDGFIYYYIPVMKNEIPQGVVRVRIQQDIIELRKAIYRKLLIIYIFLGSLLILFFGIYLLRRRIVRPIQTLIAHTQKIAGGNLNEKIIISGGRELMELAESFNIMVEALNLKQRELAIKIKELEKTNKQLIEARNEVLQAEKLASIGRMASGIAHELGNPISAISGNIELLEKGIDEAKKKEVISRLKNDVLRMDEIIRNLLDFARPKMNILQRVNLKKSIEDTIELLRPQRGFERIKINLTAEDNVIEIMGDLTQLKQVWINLFLNARDAMPEGGEIKISIKKSEPNVLVEFSDTGQGIKEEDIGKIFEPFFTTKEPGKGTGLGLTVVQRIILSMNGKINVRSEVNKGTTFSITFPLIK